MEVVLKVVTNGCSYIITQRKLKEEQ